MVKHRRKIWLAPFAALALVLVLAAMVFAQTADNEAPEVGPPIDDVEITITATDSTPSPQPTLTDAFTDADGDTLAYTAATSNERVADVALTGEATDIVTLWWDRLGAVVATTGEADTSAVPDTNCSARAAVLGFTAGAGIRGTPPEDANPHRAGLPETALGENDEVDATGLCQDFGQIATGADAGTQVVDNPHTTAVEDDYDADGAIVDAFHWNMLSGPEMIAVAQTAGESRPTDYGAPFGGLSGVDQATVSEWFAADSGFLARGTGGLAVSNDGIDSDTTNNDLPTPGDPPTPDGKPGTATIYVKASDANGRFLSASVGQSFTVTASLTTTGPLDDFDNNAERTAPGAGSIPQATYVTSDGLAGASTGVVYVQVEANPTPDSAPHRYELTIGTDAEGSIARIHARVGTNDLMQHNQKLEFLLRGDDRIQVSRAAGGLQFADVRLRSGATLVRDEEVPLTLQLKRAGQCGREQSDHRLAYTGGRGRRSADAR